MIKVLKLRARHFKGATFTSKTGAGIPKDYPGCPVEQAASEEFATNDVDGGTSHIIIGANMWLHKGYWYDDYEEDAMRAVGLDYSDDVIRELEITGHE